MSRSLLCLGVIALATIITTKSVSAQDTITNFDPRSRHVKYDDPDIIMQSARFDLRNQATITGIHITFTGPQAVGTAVVHLFGQEGGFPAPLLERDLCHPIVVQKTVQGTQTIQLTLDKPLAIDNHQVFVAVDQITPGMFLVSDSKRKQPSCTSGSDPYLYQLLKFTNGAWQWGDYAYAISLIVEYPNQGQPTLFTDASKELGLPDSLCSNRSIAVADLNGDGFLELMAGGRIFLNDGGKRLIDNTSELGISGTPQVNAFIDVNSDEHFDVIFIGQDDKGAPNHKLFINNSHGRFTEYPLETPVISHPTSLSIADVNGDEYPDVFIGQAPDSGDGRGVDILLINNRVLGFTPAPIRLQDDSSTVSAGSWGSQWVDVDNDGKLDLYIVRSAPRPSEIWVNSETGGFTRHPVLEQPLTERQRYYRPIGCAWADYDNDGTPDLLQPTRVSAKLQLANLETKSSVLTVDNTTSPRLEFRRNNEIEYEERNAGGAWADIDNDGDLDFILTTSSSCRYVGVYLQTSANTFQRVVFGSGLQYVAAGPDAVWADFDNDGRIDFSSFVDGCLRVYRNIASDANNFIEFDLTGANVIGAKVELFIDGNRISREVSSGRGLLMQEPTRIHFGIGSARSIDSAIIHWPGGNTETYHNLPVNRIMRLQAGGSFTDNAGSLHLDLSPNPFNSQVVASISLNTREHISLGVYTLDGRKVAQLIDAELLTGEHKATWDAIGEDGKPQPQGVYIFRLTVPGYGDVVKRAVLQK